jgi:hypothetical protein
MEWQIVFKRVRNFYLVLDEVERFVWCGTNKGKGKKIRNALNRTSTDGRYYLYMFREGKGKQVLP